MNVSIQLFLNTTKPSHIHKTFKQEKKWIKLVKLFDGSFYVRTCSTQAIYSFSCRQVRLWWPVSPSYLFISIPLLIQICDGSSHSSVLIWWIFKFRWYVPNLICYHCWTSSRSLRIPRTEHPFFHVPFIRPSPLYRMLVHVYAQKGLGHSPWYIPDAYNYATHLKPNGLEVWILTPKPYGIPSLSFWKFIF